MNICGGTPSRAAGNDLIMALIPFKNGAGTDTEFRANFGRNRNLVLNS